MSGSINIYDHGKALNVKKTRVECNYCGKVVSCPARLKRHLGGIRGDVVPCGKVPANVKKLFGNKEVDEIYHTQLPLKRNRRPNVNNINPSKRETNQTASSGSEKRADIDSGSEKEGKEVSSSRQVQKYIGRFFYETGIDFNAMNAPSFRRMLNVIAAHSRGHAKCDIPSCQELKGWILRDELEKVQEHVRKIRLSWESTGCSILLDEWIDEKGRNLVNFLVDCPEGPVYLCSSDLTAISGDIDALQLVLDQVIEEIGSDNVVQIVACSTTGWVGDIGKEFMNRHRTMFWTISASHCIEIMLEKIGTMDSFKTVLDKAKVITRFIHSNATIMELLRNRTHGDDLVKPSKTRYTTSFTTLENIVSKQQKLKDMFTSSEWNTSFWASTMEGKKVAELVDDVSFWDGAQMVLKATIPLVRLCLIVGADNLGTGYIYEAMDQVKETIKTGFKSKRTQYMPFWEVIDEIWNTNLHSPLHAAGYYLNPSFFYSSDFYSDAEVAAGLLCSIVRMVQDKQVQDLICAQLEEYVHARGAFQEGSAIGSRTNVSPARWWSKHGEECPELQRFAIRVLSQTQDGASRFGLNRSMAEKMLITSGRNCIEEQRLKDLTFVHYNLQLKKSVSLSGIEDGDVEVDEWMVNELAEKEAVKSSRE